MRARHSARGAALAVVAVAALIGAACDGDAPTPAVAVREVVVAVQEAAGERDPAALCELMAAVARRQAGELAHGSPRACEPDVDRALELLSGGLGATVGGVPRITRVAVARERAKVTVELPGRRTAEIPLTRGDGAWKLASFVGVEPRLARAPLARARAAGGFPAPGGVPLRVADAHERPCAPVSLDDYPVVDGGCAVTVRGEGIDIAIVTAFADIRFVNCIPEYTVTIDRTGRTWTHLSTGGPVGGGCGDVHPCVDRDGTAPKWKGRIRRVRGGYLHHVDACIESCAGIFVGPLTMPIARDGRGWRLVPAIGDVGRSGFRFGRPEAIASTRIMLERAGWPPRSPASSRRSPVLP